MVHHGLTHRDIHLLTFMIDSGISSVELPGCLLAPPQHGDPVNNFIYPYAEANGKPIAVSADIRYHLLPN
jgi:hypothetical protein